MDFAFAAAAGMAAIYSGIHLKLKSPQTPWEDKVKLARFAWISTQCLLPNKEQLLLDWCVHALTGFYSGKVDFSQMVLEGLWRYLDDLLHSRKLHSLLKQGKTISLRLNMAQLLLDRLQDCACGGSKSPVSVSTILSVCQGLFSLSPLSSVFTTKYELMVDLLAKLSFLCCRELQQPQETTVVEAITFQNEVLSSNFEMLPGCTIDCSDRKIMSESPPDQLELGDNKSSANPKESCWSANLFDVFHQVLSCYSSVQRQQANPNRVFTLVTNQLIQNLALLRHLLTSGEFAACHTHLRLRQQLCKDIRTKTDSILKMALFPSEQLSSYKEELLPRIEDTGKRSHGGSKGPLRPVATILDKLNAQGHSAARLHYAVKSTTLSLLFKFFLESYRKDRGESDEGQRMLCFYFLTRLLSALDMGINPSSTKADQPIAVHPGQTSSSESPCSPESWSVALLALESLLTQALSADIYNVAADRIRHNEVQLTFYGAAGQMLFNQAQPSIPAWYRCLKVLLSLNHLILDPDLNQLLSSVWVNADCTEIRVQRARQHMLATVLQTYTKLRQLPRLFSELLSVMCESALDNLRPPLLCAGVSFSLRTCMLDTPASQLLEVCSLVLDSIRSYILPEFLKEEEKVERMDISGKDSEKMSTGETKSESAKEDASLKLFSLGQLLHVILFSVKTLDNASPLPLVRNSQSLMKEMQQVITELAQLVSNPKTDTDTNAVSAKRTPKKRKRDLQKVCESKSQPLWQQKTEEATLLLQYTWVEVDTLFSIYCSNYVTLDRAQTTVACETPSHPAFANMESLISDGTLPQQTPLSRFLLKLLTLQQMKKTLLSSSSLSEYSTASLLNRTARFILSKSELEGGLHGEQVWDGQTGSVNKHSYCVAHWYQVTSNLPLIAAHLSGQDMGCIADTLVSSLLSGHQGKDCPAGSLTVPVISSQLLQSAVFTELPSLFSATLHSLIHRVVSVLKEAHVHKIRPVLSIEGKVEDSRLPLSSLVDTETIVQEILASSTTGEVAVLMTDLQVREIMKLLKILSRLNPDAMNPEDLSSAFLLLLYTLTSTSIQQLQKTPDCLQSGDAEAALIVELLRILTCLSEGKNFGSVLKLMHGGTLLQAVVSSLLWHSSNGRFQHVASASWLDLIKTLQGFIRCLVQLIITRNSSVRLNLDQLTRYLTGVERRQIATGSEDSVFFAHLMLASLASCSQTMCSNMGRSKPFDQTLAQMLTRMTASLKPAVQNVLKLHTGHPSVSQPAGVLSQAFVVEVVTVMLHCEQSSLSVEEDARPNGEKLNHFGLYRDFCQQILKEISSVSRPMDFVKSSLHFLWIFYKVLNEREGESKEQQGDETGERKELDELYMQILQTVHRLLTASWQSTADICQLEPAVQELLRHLVEKCTISQFNLLLMMIKEGLNIGYLRMGNYREVLSAVIVIKLLSCCQPPEHCSKSLWLFAPQIISTLVDLVQASSQDTSLTLTFTVPAVTSVTSLVRQGEGLITNPHHVIVVLGALQAMPLDHLTPQGYQTVFLTVHEALFAIIQCHPQVMLNAAPSFLTVFHRLVASIMQEGRQRGDSDTGSSSDIYLQCSRLTERMYSHIAATAESFTTLSAFMVAQYVTELQKVTLRPDIKVHLTEGIYQILDLCIEQDIKFLTAGLQTGVREVFNALYASYTHYHKAQRQGEDKYTV